jgi:Holliday junction DNA helicase RuvA
MISTVKGKIINKGITNIVVMTNGGVGYEIHLTPAHASKVASGKEVEIPTYLRVTDSSLDLFGFESAEEREFFVLLLSVSGVGPKTAMSVLSLGSLNDIQSAIARSDVKYLTAVKGMGGKTAERLCVELKSKVQSSGSGVRRGGEGGVLSEVIDGLVALGYSKEEARGAVEGVETEGKTTEEVLKRVLRDKK